MKIFKYPIEASDYFSLDLPKGAKILTVQVQHEMPFIWALVNPNVSKEMRHFKVAGTGHNIDEHPDALIYIGTFQLSNGALVFHLFERSTI